MLGYQCTKPIGFYPPLIWRDDLDKINSVAIRFVVFANLMLRFLIYPFIFTISICTTAIALVIATIFNLGYLFGGYTNIYWSQKTKYFNQIAFIRCQWILFDGFAFVWNQAQFFWGLFRPQHGIFLLTKLKKFTEELSESSFFYFDWQEPHLKLIRKLRNFLNKHNFLITSMVVCTLSEEPFESISFGFKMVRGIWGEIHVYNLNPFELTNLQANSQPVLLLHGDLHNQSAWLPLAAYLHHKKYPGPVFTINLPSLNITVRDKNIIEAKLDEIKILYANKNNPNVKVTLIGHSRGACLAFNRLFYHRKSNISGQSDEETYEFVYFTENDAINKVILMGNSSEDFSELHVIEANKHNACFFINGRRDLFLSSPDTSEGVLVNSGHLGLLSNPEAMEYCYKKLMGQLEIKSI